MTGLLLNRYKYMQREFEKNWGLISYNNTTPVFVKNAAT